MDINSISKEQNGHKEFLAVITPKSRKILLHFNLFIENNYTMSSALGGDFFC